MIDERIQNLIMAQMYASPDLVAVSTIGVGSVGASSPACAVGLRGRNVRAQFRIQLGAGPGDPQDHPDPPGALPPSGPAPRAA
uniref:Uncharacterized protein n=1 Tax=Phenylobacterium glaciei TaxID=2803784 RepID=A0A974P537_9CAUL|nr:hypothetical protein JKL49_03210 [Phenylobacterium glaciei]